jgi:hypothetical protein
MRVIQLTSDLKIYWTEQNKIIYYPCRKSGIHIKLLYCNTLTEQYIFLVFILFFFHLLVFSIISVHFLQYSTKLVCILSAGARAYFFPIFGRNYSFNEGQQEIKLYEEKIKNIMALFR